jgi:hypothetical protein
VRAPGGYTPDLVNYAHSFDVYKIWADMVTYGTSECGKGGETFYATYASRRDIYTYAHSHEEVMARYGDVIVMQGRMADVLSDDLGNDFYIARFKRAEDRDEFAAFVQQHA